MKTSTKTNDLSLPTVFRELALPILNQTAISDSRSHNIVHTALDALKSGFAVFTLKSQSLFAFQPKLPAEEANLKSVFGIEKLPSDNGLRNILDQLDASLLNQGFDRVLPYLDQYGALDKYRYWNGHLICSIDGVQHQCSNKVKCEQCLVRNHKNGSQTFAHSMLTAALVCPNQAETFVLGNEPIVKQDGQTKNDCERNAAQRLFDRLLVANYNKPMVYVLDALYACAPVVRKINAAEGEAKYIINAKEDGNKYLFKQFDELNQAGKVDWKTVRNKTGNYRLAYVNDLSINKSNAEVKCNFLYCVVKSPKGKETVFSYITNIELHRSNLMAIMWMGRSRWKIENEVFNTLKNQQYNYGHNFGHGKKHLATNFAYLMMLAFTVDQILQRCSRDFERLHKKMKTRIGLWLLYRSVFLTTNCESVEDFWRNMLLISGIRVI